MSLPKLSGSKRDMEASVREAVRSKFANILGESVTHNRERYIEGVPAYLRLFALVDPVDKKTRIRGVMVKLAGFGPMLDDETCGCTPIKLRYSIEVLFGFEDLKSDNGNSTDDFNGFLMDAFDAFELDRQLGYRNLSHDLLSQEGEDLDVTFLDDVLCHMANLTLEVEVFCS